jgi:hypothetical protein
MIAPYPRITDLVPWREHALPRAPWDDADCHNPSILRVPDDAGDAHAGAWLCNIRATSYPAACSIAHHWPGHPRFKSHHEADHLRARSRSHCSHTRNWLLMLDADRNWQPIDGREIAYARGIRPPSCAYNYVGYEDLRLGWSPKDGLVASGTTLLHNDRGAFEIACLELDAEGQIWRATPLRGWWSDQCQKNWSPILGLPSARWLHSPIGGGVVDKVGVGAPEPRAFSPTLCGGTQLVPVRLSSDPDPDPDPVPVPDLSPSHFLGLAHGYDPLPDGGRHYWHRVFVVGADGETIRQSPPFKLSEYDIDFACGLAIDPHTRGRAIVTYGVGNTASRLAETSLSALLGLCGPSA